MQSRLENIDSLVSSGYTVGKYMGAIPYVASKNGNRKNLYWKGVAGFSPVAFFFPWAVCTQIKEWGYFGVYAGIMLISSAMAISVSIATGLSLDILSGISFQMGYIASILYGYWYPYLRYIKIKSSVQEIPGLLAIPLGLLLSLFAVIPSLVLEALFS